MSKLVVNTHEISVYLKDVHRHLSDQEETVREHLRIVNQAKETLAPKDLSVVDYALTRVEQLGKQYVNEKMPPIHDMLPSARPLEPYQQAVLTINQYLSDHEITPFIREMREIHPVNRTMEVAGTDGLTVEDVVNAAGEISGFNDLYRVFDGRDPRSGKKLTEAEWWEAVGWSILTIFPPSKWLKLGKMSKAGRSAVGGLKAFKTVEKLNEVRENISRVVKAGRRLKKKGTLPKRKVNEPLKKYAKRLSSVFNRMWQNRPTSPGSPSRQDGQRLGIIESGDTWWKKDPLGRKTGYKFKEGLDLDYRNTGKTYKDALEEAFKRTGVPKIEFVVTKWGKDSNGKSFPVEWRAKNGAEVNIDVGHVTNGPDVPHIGYQSGGKRKGGKGGAKRGHILVDDVPYNR